MADRSAQRYRLSDQSHEVSTLGALKSKILMFGYRLILLVTLGAILMSYASISAGDPSTDAMLARYRSDKPTN